MMDGFKKTPKDWEKRQRKILADKKQAADEKFQKIAAQALERVKARSSAPYDGVLGTPPDWLRGPRRQEFERRRADLLAKYSGDEILEFMQANREIYQPGFKSIKPIPPKIMDSIDFLCHVQKAVSLGEEKGLIMFAGEDAERGAKVLKGVLYAHETKHGTAEKKAERWQHFKDECLKVHDENPRWGLTKIRQEVAARTGYSLKTIERHTKTLRSLIDRLS